jgi:hypothetical protein
MERPNFEMDDVTDRRQNYVMGQAERLRCPKCGGVSDFGGVTFRREGTAHVPVL